MPIPLLFDRRIDPANRWILKQKLDWNLFSNVNLAISGSANHRITLNELTVSNFITTANIVIRSMLATRRYPEPLNRGGGATNFSIEFPIQIKLANSQTQKDATKQNETDATKDLGWFSFLHDGWLSLFFQRRQVELPPRCAGEFAGDEIGLRQFPCGQARGQCPFDLAAGMRRFHGGGEKITTILLP